MTDYANSITPAQATTTTREKGPSYQSCGIDSPPPAASRKNGLGDSSDYNAFNSQDGSSNLPLELAEHHDSKPFLHLFEDRTEAVKFLAGVAGNILEWYDFTLYGYFSDIIANHFFPDQGGDAALIQSFAVMAGGFLVRPFGGAMIGYIGDKYGSQRALEISIFLMAIPTFAMGCLPSYERIGILSPVLLVIVRLLQGISVGGQLTSSMVFTLEHQPRERWGLFGSLVMTVATFGCLLGSFVGYLMREMLTEEQLQTWGWRLPFLSGILLSMCGFYLRDHADEAHTSGTETDSSKPEKNPLEAAFRSENRQPLLSTALVAACFGAGYYIPYVWMPIFMTDLIDNPVNGAFGINTLSLLITGVILFPIGGMAADKYGSQNLMFAGSVVMILLSPVFVVIISRGDEMPAFWAQTGLGIISILFGAPACAWFVQIFPREIRLTSVSIGYNLGLAVGGGFAPMIATYVTSEFGSHASGYLLSVFGICGLCGLCLAPSAMKPSKEIRSKAEVLLGRKDGSSEIV